MKVYSGGEDVGVGNDSIDGEHRILVGLVDAIADQVEQGANPSMLRGLLEKLVEYTNTHFLSEQLLMRLYSYPDYEAHVQEHDRLLADLRDLRQRIEKGEAPLTGEVVTALRSWVCGHIRGQDSALARFLERRGQPGET
jgi:hemerythrin